MSIAEIKDIKLPVEVVVGASEHTVEEIASLGVGTIIELDSVAGEPVQIRAGGEVVAFGEVVVIDENYGVRVTSLVADRDRGRTDG